MDGTQILITIITSATGVIVTAIVSWFIAYMKKKKEQKIEHEKQLENLVKEKAERDQREERLVSIITTNNTETDKKFSMVLDSIKIISKDIESLKKSTQSSLRHDILEMFEKCQNKKFATIEEQQTFHKMYEEYHNLGGNSFVDALIEKFDKIPSEAPKKKPSSKKKKILLLEKEN